MFVWALASPLLRLLLQQRPVTIPPRNPVRTQARMELRSPDPHRYGGVVRIYTRADFKWGLKWLVIVETHGKLISGNSNSVSSKFKKKNVKEFGKKASFFGLKKKKHHFKILVKGCWKFWTTSKPWQMLYKQLRCSLDSGCCSQLLDFFFFKSPT